MVRRHLLNHPPHVVLIKLDRHLETTRPDLGHVARAELAAKIMRRTTTTLTRDGDLLLRDDAQALIDEGKPEPQPKAPPPPKVKPDTSALIADHAAVLGSDKASRAKRAALKEQIAKTTLGTDYASTPENP